MTIPRSTFALTFSLLKGMRKIGSFRLWSIYFLGFVLINGFGGVQAWSKEGHIMTCKIAQVCMHYIVVL